MRHRKILLRKAFRAGRMRAERADKRAKNDWVSHTCGCYSLQWDCVLVGITRAAIYPHQGGALALHCPAYNPKSWGDSHVFRSRYSVIAGSRLFLSHGHCL